MTPTTQFAEVYAEARETSAVSLRGLHKTFGTGSSQVHAVRGVGLTIRPGEIVAFVDLRCD